VGIGAAKDVARLLIGSDQHCVYLWVRMYALVRVRKGTLVVRIEVGSMRDPVSPVRRDISMFQTGILQMFSGQEDLENSQLFGNT
jgi:hypothetical protein